VKTALRALVPLFALVGGYALAGTSDTVSLSGTVTTTLSIDATDTAGATALDIDGEGSAGEHIVKVADVAMTTNNEQGLTLTFSGGNLTKTGGTSIAYRVVTVADGASAPVTGDSGWAAGSTTFQTSAAGDSARDLYIKYTPAALQDPGTYTGSISLSISDNP
jgi:hypothetical protein